MGVRQVNPWAPGVPGWFLTDDQVKALRERAWQFLHDSNVEFRTTAQLLPGHAEVEAMASMLDGQIALRHGSITMTLGPDGRPTFRVG